jgi:hypothetical protein
MTYVGTDYFNQQPVYIDLTKHTCVVGGSGMGKSTLIANCYTDAVRSNLGVGLIDPHGDLADTATRSHPTSRMWDFIYADPHGKRIIPMNPFYYSTPEELELRKDAYFQIKKALAGAAWGDETARVTINAIDAVCQTFSHPSPVHEFRFLAADQFRTKVLAKTYDPFLKMFREQYDDKLRPTEQMSKFSPAINKTSKLMRPILLPIIGHDKSIDFLKIMNESRVIVFRLPKGRGEEEAIILGSIAVSSFSISALRREKQRERPYFILMIDEAPNFAHGGRFSSLLAESRKYAIGLFLSLQGMYQVPFARDILSNCANQIIFNASGEDAELMARNWGKPELAQQITDLPKYHFYLRHFKNVGTEKDPTYSPIVQMVKAAPPIKRRGDEATPTKLIKHSLERWGTDRKAAEAKIMKFLAS